MTFDDLDMDDTDFDSEDAAGEAGNRTFLLVAGILGAITLLAIICIVVYAFFWVPRNRSAEQTQVARINATNTSIAEALAATALAQSFTATPSQTATATRIPPTATSTVTPVVRLDTPTSPPTQDPFRLTVDAQQTQLALLGLTPTPTALPGTGFMDEVGLPGMLGAAVLLLVVIVFARRLRMA